jgi:hypothetical protein
VSKEVESGTDATISCVVSGITSTLDSVVWRKDGTDVKSLSESDYVVSEGIYGANSQTTTLTVKAAANVDDSTYTCAITSNEWKITNRESVVTLNTFCKFSLDEYDDCSSKYVDIDADRGELDIAKLSS